MSSSRSRRCDMDVTMSSRRSRRCFMDIIISSSRSRRCYMDIIMSSSRTRRSQKNAIMSSSRLPRCYLNASLLSSWLGRCFLIDHDDLACNKQTVFTVDSGLSEFAWERPFSWDQTEADLSKIIKYRLIVSDKPDFQGNMEFLYSHTHSRIVWFAPKNTFSKQL